MIEVKKLAISTISTLTSRLLIDILIGFYQFVKTLLPIALGDLGIRESAAVEFFSYINVKNTTAFNASIMLFAINVLFPSVVGLFFVLKNRLGNGSQK